MKPQREEYDGHRIELRKRDDKLELFIDNARVRHGQLTGGLYFLHDYAYDWDDDLMKLARKFIDYKRKTDKIRRERESGKKGG